MTSVSHVEQSLKYILEERANVLARETGCIERQRNFSGADLLQTLVFGWLSHPDASLETLADVAATREVQATDTAIHKRFTRSCARFLHAILEEMTGVVIEAEREVPLDLVRRFEAIVLEDSSTVALPNELAACWQGCGGAPGEGQAAVKLHVRWDLKRGGLQGPMLTHGRINDRSSPFKEEPLPIGSLYIADLGYVDWGCVAARRAAGSYTLTRAQARTMYWTPEGKPLKLDALLPQRVGQAKDLWVRVADEHRYLMRLLMIRVPEEVAERRRADLEADAKRRGQPVRERAWKLADWTILLTDVPANLLSLQEALVLLRERWQMEMLYKLWKQYGRIDEWQTTNSWRVLCELYAKLIGLLLQHWLILLFAWQDEQRSLVKLAQVVRDTASSLLEALAGDRSFLSALQAMKRSHAFRVPNEQAQEASECRPAPPAEIDELGPGSLSWCVWVLAETVPQLVWTTRADGLLDYCNQRFCDYTGLTLEHVQSDPWAFIHPEDREGSRALVQHSLDTGIMYEHEERFRNVQTEEYRWFLSRGMPVRDETGQIIKWFGTSTDIEDQKRAEEALRQSQEHTSVLMNSNIIGIFVGEREQIVDANETFLRMTGYSREDLRTGRMNWMHMTPPEYLARTQQAHQELAAQQSMTPYEKEYICQDGSRLPVLVGGILLPHSPFQVINFVLDNSARKELEQRKDDFINMASHELRNPLAALKMQTQLVRKRLERQSHHEAATALSRVEGPVKQLERLIAELLDVSKIQAGSLEYVQEQVDLDEVLREVTATIHHLRPSHTIQVRGSVQTSLIGDRDRLGQVFTNLLSNAIKYSPDAQTVEMDLDASEDVVTIRVHDRGLGIPREQRDKIFERFYRATGPKQRAIPGLGIGLYIVAEIVKGHGGTITVESDVGKGSTFTVTLPRRRDA